jgi:DNA-binding transcriptional MerR regulator
MVAYQSTGEAARSLGLSENALQQELRRHPHLAPTLKVGGRRAWTPEDVQRVREVRAARGVSQ